MDPHRLAERRSAAYHRAVLERLRREPELLDRARAQCERALARGGRSAHLAARWRTVLEGGLDAIERQLLRDDDDARRMRSSSPFAGVLTPGERWALWRRVADEATSATHHDPR